MEGKEFKLKNGATLIVSYAPFEDGCALFKAVSECLRKNNIQNNSIESAGSVLFCDPDVYRLTFVCAKKAIYRGRKIDASLFDDNQLGAEASSSLLEIFSTILSFNIERFLPVASSALEAISTTPA
jgi:hypothetical protein